MRARVVVFALALVAALPALAAPPIAEPEIVRLRRLFKDPPDDSRPMMRWWWFGPAVTKPELERELRLMKEGGIGGFEVQAVYPVDLDTRVLPFLSDEFLDALRFVSEKAAELGLRMDVTLGSGWPYGGPTVPIGQAAGQLRVERVSVPEGARRVPWPALVAGESPLAAFLARSRDGAVVPETLRPITDGDDSVLRLPAGLSGPHQAVFFVASRTGMMVKRPAVGGEGFVVDHYDRTALDAYLKNVGDRLLSAFGPRPPFAVFCDSLEVYASDWTGDFLAQFEKRRGYDLRPHLPALAFETGKETKGVRHDWGRTLTELLDESFLAPLRAWANEKGTRLRLQGYGTPPATIASNAHADLSEGEGWQWKTLKASRWAASANHLYGRPVTSAETWTWLHSPSFRATPLDMKAEADLHFLQGVNQLIGHGWPYSAPDAPYPGWRFYAAGVFSEKNPWWIVMPDLSRYLQRLSFVLREGRPRNDVALYLPNADAWAGFTAGKVHMNDALAERIGKDVIARVLEAGFGLDFFDDASLDALGRVEAGALVLGANRYRAVVLPGVESVPLASLRRLEAFARAGGVLVATRRTPETAPGHLASAEDQAAVRDLSRQLFEGPGARGRFVADENRDLGATLRAGLRPDVLLSPPVPEIGFVHRTTPGAEIYFLANTSNTRQRAAASFRVEETRAEWWDPLTGLVSPAVPRPAPNGGQAVALDLEPYGSRVLVFSKRALERSAGPAAPDAPFVDVSTGWRVSFGPSAPSVPVDGLPSWTDDEATRHFSGVGVYERTVAVPERLVARGLAVRLELGEGRALPVSPGARFRAWLDGPVREAAVVYVNGRRAGSVWCPPYALDVTGLLRAGDNELRIEVANLALNHMAGRARPDPRLLNLRYGVRFENQDQDGVQAIPAGLFGPIRLTASGAPGGAKP